MSDRKNLKVDPETFNRLSEDKADGMTWDLYLRMLHQYAFADYAIPETDATPAE